MKELYTTRHEVEYMVTTLETRETTLRQVESGTVPDVPDVTHRPVDTRDPEVVTVQVRDKGFCNKYHPPSLLEAIS